MTRLRGSRRSVWVGMGSIGRPVLDSVEDDVAEVGAGGSKESSLY